MRLNFVISYSCSCFFKGVKLKFVYRKNNTENGTLFIENGTNFNTYFLQSQSPRYLNGTLTVLLF